jgi:hypothetical protein
MAFKPDYGMAMITHGCRPGLELVWFELAAYNVDTVEPGKYCTTLEIENVHAGRQVCCMTIDMDRERLMELLKIAGGSIARDVIARLNRGQARIDLEEGVRFMLEGILGKPVRGLHEAFAPIIAKKIGPSQPR